MYREWKQKAIQLRKQGHSYNMILDDIPVSKSTLSLWLSGIPFKPNEEVKRRTKAGLLKSSMKRHQVTLKSIKRARQDAEELVGQLTKRDLLMFGLGVYLGEGSKSDQNTRVINSDPRVIQLSILWLKQIFDITDNHFVMMLHLYPDCDEKKSLKYWQKVTGLPLSQFQKVQVDKRENKSSRKRRKLPHGTAHLRVKALGNSEFGVQLFRKIMSSIEVVFTGFGIIISEQTD